MSAVPSKTPAGLTSSVALHMTSDLVVNATANMYAELWAWNTTESGAAIYVFEYLGVTVPAQDSIQAAKVHDSVYSPSKIYLRVIPRA